MTVCAGRRRCGFLRRPTFVASAAFRVVSLFARVSLSPRFRGWRVKRVMVEVEPVDGSIWADVYASAEIDGDPVVGERAFRALVREAASAVGVRVLDGGDLDDRSLGVRDLELRSSGCCG